VLNEHKRCPPHRYASRDAAPRLETGQDLCRGLLDEGGVERLAAEEQPVEDRAVQGIDGELEVGVLANLATRATAASMARRRAGTTSS